MQMDSDSDLKFHDDSVSDEDIVLHLDSVSDDDTDFHDDLVSNDDDGNFDAHYDDDGDDDNANFYDNSVSDEGQEKQSYRILNASDIRRIQEKDIASVCSLLSVTAPSARVLLYHYEWNLESLMEQWFADEERVRKEVGLVQKGLNTSIGSTFVRFTCEICFDEFCAGDQIMNRFCDHKYCKTCLVSYISTAIDDGPGCLSLRCPDPSCNAAIGVDVVNLLVYRQYMKKYNEFFVRSYVEGNSNVKWCPAPDCDAAIQYNGDGESGSYEVVCDCSCKFCWRCTEDGHRPVDCDTVARWIKKNKCEESNVEWILAYTKPCPKCKRPIQKNDGCMHMTCNSMCKHQFCWTCLHPWSDSHNCNAYEAELNGETIKEAKRRKEARALVERYTHYYERWDANQRSRMKAQSDLEMMQRKNTHVLCERFAVTELQFTCVIEAWQQIIEYGYRRECPIVVTRLGANTHLAYKTASYDHSSYPVSCLKDHDSSRGSVRLFITRRTSLFAAARCGTDYTEQEDEMNFESSTRMYSFTFLAICFS
uniref:RBR-type E3 ubiquitin transferase n=1 Tax=Daucus carota subsp. sativus TaxID=79200 RepID=A0A166A4L8_DAUCS